ncbi:DUF2239 family protein [Bordetella genomosp. 10]|nr:DUF2239 family protein [Bordetella genomosp. 10]
MFITPPSYTPMPSSSPVSKTASSPAPDPALAASSFTSFDGHRRLASGSIQDAAIALKQALDKGAAGPLLLFDDSNGRTVDIDTRGTAADVVSRLAAHPVVVAMALAAEAAASAVAAEDVAAAAQPRGRGRPRLGVVAREVTLLPRHWEWLAAQPGGASIALRKLVEEARRSGGEKARIRKARESAYHFMLAVGGDLPGFEEASRALFADDRAAFAAHIDAWPADVRDHALRLGFDNAAESAAQ